MYATRVPIHRHQSKICGVEIFNVCHFEFSSYLSKLNAGPRDYPRTQICKIGVKAPRSTPTTLSVCMLGDQKLTQRVNHRVSFGSF